jgi:hypothetical protein
MHYAVTVPVLIQNEEITMKLYYRGILNVLLAYHDTCEY